MIDLVRLQNCVTPDLVKPEHKFWSKNKLAGACYITSEAAYHLGLKERGFRPARKIVQGIVHWFLVNKAGNIFDPTVEQFPLPVDYSKYKFRAFLTKEPSRRASQIIERYRQQ